MINVARLKDSMQKNIIFFVIFNMIFLSPIYRGNKILVFLFINILLIFLLKCNKYLKKEIICLIFYITVVYLISLTNSTNISRTSYFYFAIMFLILSYLNFYAYFMNKEENFYKTIKIITFLGNLIILYSLVESVIKYNPIFCNLFTDMYKIGYSKPAEGLYRVNGSIGQPVPFSNFAIFMICINFLQYKIKKNKRNIILCFASIVSLLLTYTRSAYISFIVSIFIIAVIFVIMNKKVKKKYVILVLGSSIIFILLGIYMINYDSKFLVTLFGRFDNIKKDLSFSQRYMGIEFVVKFLSVSLVRCFFGYGVGSLINIRSYYSLEFLIADFYALDNQYFTFIFEFGIIGAFIIIAYLIKFIKNIIFKTNNIELMILSTSLLALLIGQFFYDATYWIIILFFISINIAMVHYKLGGDLLGEKS